ncbi:MAG: hypothetical protein N0E58_08515 [Candidatus Thiodiazotropha endolucinida]|uniref:Uncharacterized protein n=1 Tax=Candidatus Thiodiazotropha taylori TaxID=2792791 RepID=A0A9E4NJ33_9GAMM|nr:hypothetical protein [Candidatus Thiodiazotropha taylori]MCW4236295.1 hypothetical protein [Candidatus Thiodiazotropha endolucinida]
MDNIKEDKLFRCGPGIFTKGLGLVEPEQLVITRNELKISAKSINTPFCHLAKLPYYITIVAFPVVLAAINCIVYFYMILNPLRETFKATMNAPGPSIYIPIIFLGVGLVIIIFSLIIGLKKIQQWLTKDTMFSLSNDAIDTIRIKFLSHNKSYDTTIMLHLPSSANATVNINFKGVHKLQLLKSILKLETLTKKKNLTVYTRVSQ